MEFLKNMRHRREEEIQEARKAFDIFEDKATSKLSTKNLGLAVAAVIGQQVRQSTLKKALARSDENKEITLDVFVDVLSFCRKENASLKRCQAGFGDTDIDK